MGSLKQHSYNLSLYPLGAMRLERSHDFSTIRLLLSGAATTAKPETGTSYHFEATTNKSKDILQVCEVMQQTLPLPNPPSTVTILLDIWLFQGENEDLFNNHFSEFLFPFLVVVVSRNTVLVNGISVFGGEREQNVAQDVAAASFEFPVAVVNIDIRKLFETMKRIQDSGLFIFLLNGEL
mmetsp:Transcript_17266/g.30124  ORF Transcript_17266/g.30124 Transcript_17266/m.30124 type:complete len:180 (+) Transcript_17266:1-540(+)